MTRKIDISLLSANSGATGQFSTVVGGGVVYRNVYASNVLEDGTTTTGNVYFTNTRAISAFTGGTGVAIAANGLIVSSAGFTGNTNAVPEGSANLYFTNTRTISALTSGTGISIAANGLITGTASGGGGTSGNVSEKYNRTINNTVAYPITAALANAVVIPSGAANTYIVHSIYVTNIDSNLSTNVAVTGNFVFSSSAANVSFANKIPVPARGSLELLRKPQILQANDLIKLQSFDSGVALGNLLHSIVVYENKSSVEGYVGVGINSDVITGDVYVSTGVSTIIDSIKLVNSGDIGNVAITVTWTDAANVIQSYFTSTLIVPQNSSIELCEAPKRIPAGHRVRALATSTSQVSVLLSGRTL